MRLTRLNAHRFLSFADLDCTIGPRLTVVVGPNGAGKTNLTRAIHLTALALHAVATGQADDLEFEYRAAGRNGAHAWSVTVGVEFDADELATIGAWLTGCLLTSHDPGIDEAAQRAWDVYATRPTDDVALMFARGYFTVAYDRTRRSRWSVTWTSDNADPAPWSPVRLDLRSNLAASIHGRRQRRLFGQAYRDALLQAQQLAGLPSGVDRPAPEGFTGPTAVDLARTGGIELTVRQTVQDREPDPVRRVLDVLDIDASESHRLVGFASIADLLFSRSVLRTDNVRRPPRRRWPTADLDRRPSSASGEDLALALLQLKNGDVDSRLRFGRTQALFRRITGDPATLDVTVNAAGSTAAGSTTAGSFADAAAASDLVTVTPVVHDHGVDIPLHLAGAGRTEVASLALLLSSAAAALVLDEPATNLSPAAQRQLATVLTERAEAGVQLVVVTHSSHLLLTPLPDVIRLRPTTTGTSTWQVPSGSSVADRAGVVPVELRDALFASGVLLVEGPTEAAALRTWLQATEPTAEQAGVLVVPVDGHANYPSYMRSLDTLGVAWVALADGPAFAQTLHRYRDDAPRHDFDAATTYWSARGVHTLADEFGTGDRRQMGEIEVFFEQVDADRWTRIRREEQGKVRAAGRFAAETPVPDRVRGIWRAVLDRVVNPAEGH